MLARVTLLAAAVALLVTGGAFGHAPDAPYRHSGSHVPGLPDLTSNPAEKPRLDDSGSQVADQLLLRFDGFIHNRSGAGTLELHGTDRVDTESQPPEMQRVFQRVYTGTGTTWNDVLQPSARMIYEANDGHEHWHLRAAARYSLRTADGAAEAAPNAKVGFCAVDTENDYDRLDETVPYTPGEWTFETAENDGHGNCGDLAPDAAQAVMGLTPGWRDGYWSNLWFQWVDVSNVLPGQYLIRTEVDPLDYVEESDETNAPSDTPVTIPGYLAQPVSRTQLSTTAPSRIALDLDDVAGPLDATREPPQVRIVDGPDHGSLDVPTGQWRAVDLTDAAVTYTPGPDGPGTDSFVYEVREGTSPYPRAPSRATASLALSGPTPPAEQIAVSGAPEMLYTGTSARLQASVVNPRAGSQVVWSVDGIRGGDARVGTVDAAGLYRAPAAVPAGGRVQVVATSPSGTTGRADMRIEAPPVRAPAPTVDPVPPPGQQPAGPMAPVTPLEPRRTLPRPRPAVGGLKAVRRGRYVVVSFLPGRSGRVRTALTSRGRKAGACSSRVSSGRRYTCRLRVPSRAAKLRVRVVARRLDGRGAVVRSVALRARRR